MRDLYKWATKNEGPVSRGSMYITLEARCWYFSVFCFFFNIFLCHAVLVIIFAASSALNEKVMSCNGYLRLCVCVFCTQVRNITFVTLNWEPQLLNLITFLNHWLLWYWSGGLNRSCWCIFFKTNRQANKTKTYTHFVNESFSSISHSKLTLITDTIKELVSTNCPYSMQRCLELDMYQKCRKNP